LERKLVDIEKLRKILLKVRKPAQYIGGEINSVVKENYKTLITFIFPDTYEIGMSHLGGTILYHILNKVNDVSCQRAYMPTSDMNKELRNNDFPIYTLEEKIDISSSDAVMFSLLYELNYTNVLEMLSLSKIPIYYKDRNKNDTIIIGGGSIMINPKPVADFFDCIVIGDGEDIVIEIAEILKLDITRDEKLEKLSKLKGAWVPKYGDYDVTFRRVSSLSGDDYPTKRVVPNIKPIHDRISVEVMRGCVRGCRYCNAGMIYRPFREKSLEEIFNEVINTHQQSGFDEVGYLSLSTTDYSQFPDLVVSTMKLKSKMGINFAIPSTRLDKLPIEMGKLDFAKNSLTLAPECGTDRLRRIINKDIRNEEILESVDFAFKNGWQTIKLYFMVGLPGENDDDIDGLIDLVNKIKELAYKYAKNQRTSLNISLGAFTPRPLTPFQWSEFQSTEILIDKFKKIKHSLRDRKIKVSYRDPYISLIETILVRGDETVSSLIYKVWEKGGLLQAWDEHLDKRLWLNSMDELGFNRDELLGEWNLDKKLAWDFVDSGIKKEYLKKEYLKAKSGEVTEDCKYGSCSVCGVCGPEFQNIEKSESFNIDSIIPESYKIDNGRNFFRLVITQLGDSVYFSTKDFRDKVKKALIVAGLPLTYSEGFSHKLRASFSDPNNFGVFSNCELAEFESKIAPTDEYIEKANDFLPDGIKILSYKNSNKKFTDSISGYIRALFSVEMYSKEEYLKFKEAIKDDKLFYQKKNKKGKLQDIIINDRIESIEYDDDRNSFIIDMYTSGSKTLRFDLLFETTNGKNWLDICKIVKKEIFFSK